LPPPDSPEPRDTLNAVSFPRFVTELITGVFTAMNDSNQQQLTAFVELLRNVAQTTEGFADSNVGVAGARKWLAERFPGSFVIEGADEEDFAEDLTGLDPEERRERQAEIQAERDAATRLVMRPGASRPSDAALHNALGVAEGESIAAGDPKALVPFARQTLARSRQQLLATMVQMGMQRIVIESGRLKCLDALPYRYQQRRRKRQGIAFRCAQYVPRQHRREIRAVGRRGKGAEHHRLRHHRPHQHK
jgi:hypothetical protein